MNKTTTWRKVLSILFAVVMLVSVTIVGTLTASAEETDVAFVGDTGYATLADAVANAQSGETITLCADVNENVTLSQAVTIDGANHTYTGTIKLADAAVTTVIKNVNFVGGGITSVKNSKRVLTVKNCTFDGTGSSLNYAITVNAARSTLVIEDCSAKNYSYGMLYTSNAIDQFRIKNVSVENVEYGFHIARSNAGTFENVTVSNATYGIFAQNYSSRTYTVTNCELSCDYPIYVWEKSTGIITFNFQGENTFITNNSDFGTFANIVNPENLTIIPASKPVAEVNGVQYNSLQEALDAANDGETVTVIADHILNMMDVDHFALVSGEKSITLDINGHNITCDPHDINKQTDYFTVFHIMNGATLTVKDGKGTGKVTADGANTWLAYMFKNDATTIIESGNFELSAITGGAMFFSSNSNMTVNGGNFTQVTNGWMFNTAGNGVGNVITVSGGTYNRNFLGGSSVDPQENPWGEVVLAEGCNLVDNGNGTWTVEKPATFVAQIGDVQYTDLQAAIDAAVDGDTITLIDNINIDSGNAFNGGEFNYNILFLVENKEITIDFGGYYINVTTNEAGDATPAISGYLVAVIFTNNGSNLTLQGEGGIKVTETNLHIYDLIYNNDSTLLIKGGEYVSAARDCLVYGDGNHNTAIAGGNFTITNLGSFNADGTQNKPWISNTQGKNESYVIYSGGTFNQNPRVNYVDSSNFDKEAHILEGYKIVDNGDGTWSVVFDGFIKIGDTAYDTLADAIAAVKNGETIELLADCDENVTIKQVAGLSFTINGNGHNYTGTITVDGDKRSAGKETLTLTGINFVLSTRGDKGINAHNEKNRYPHNITVDHCTFTAVDAAVDACYGIYVRHAYNIVIKDTTANNLTELLYANTSITGLTVENVTINNGLHGFYLAYGTGNMSFTNVVTNGVTTSAITYMNQSTNGQNIKITNCEFDAPIVIEQSKTYNTVLTLSGVTSTASSWLKVTGETANVKVNFAGEKLPLEGIAHPESYTAFAGENTYVIAKAITFKSSQILLGSTIGLVFNVDSFFKGLDLEAVVTGNGNTTIIPSSEWQNGTKIVFNGIAAKQMIDEFTITIVCNGSAVSESITDSIRGYVARGIEKNIFNDKDLALLTAMLNYGAETQKALSYKTDDLANSILNGATVEDVEVKNELKATHYFGSSVNFDSALGFNFKFMKAGLENAEKAIISYVNKNGENVQTEVELVTEYNQKHHYYILVAKFDTFNAEDATAIFTCEVVDADGNVLAYAHDSVLSYCARAIEGLGKLTPGDYNWQTFKIPFYQALANYIVAASNYDN